MTIELIYMIGSGLISGYAVIKLTEQKTDRNTADIKAINNRCDNQHRTKGK